MAEADTVSPSDNAQTTVHPVIVVGAGPVGLATAIDLAQRGNRVIVLDEDELSPTGSRAICFAKRTLEIFDRLGCGDAMVARGVGWNVGKVFFNDGLVYEFDLLAESGHERPAFINLQQYHVESYLHVRALREPNLTLRWHSRVTGLVQDAESVTLSVDTAHGQQHLQAQYVVAADGSRSGLRALMGLEASGRVFKDRFLIADVRMEAPFPSERWFWFDPPFHPNQSVLLHRQPDNLWRIDFQLGWDADPVLERAPERVIPRVQALLGADVAFTLEWVSVYTFACRRMDSFRHQRILFAGDAAHGVSPFGARGANSGIQDADNLAWKLDLVLRGAAPTALLDTYASEREMAADENILNSTRATDFITPKSAVSRLFRDAVLTLAKEFPFARKLVNSGRLSLPSVYADSHLNTADRDQFIGAMVPGAPCTDAPVMVTGTQSWLLRQLGRQFTILYFSDGKPLAPSVLRMLQSLVAGNDSIALRVIVPNSGAGAVAGLAELVDRTGLLARRYDATPGTCYLVRPDQHVCGRWRTLEATAVRAARARAICRT